MNDTHKIPEVDGVLRRGIKTPRGAHCWFRIDFCADEWGPEDVSPPPRFCDTPSCVHSIYKNREVFTFHNQIPFVTSEIYTHTDRWRIWTFVRVTSPKVCFLLIYGAIFPQIPLMFGMSWYFIDEKFFFGQRLFWLMFRDKRFVCGYQTDEKLSFFSYSILSSKTFYLQFQTTKCKAKTQ